MSNISQAIEEWRTLLGAAFVTTDTAAAEQATFATTQHIPAVIEPAHVADVQACVRVAAKYGIRLYPISRGQNWGLGSQVPPVDGAVLLDLNRLNHIVDYNERFATLTVEPGVTFEQAVNFLQQRRSPHFLSVTGGPPNGSIIGNTLERGHGVGRYTRRYQSITNLDVVLADSTLLHTGMNQYEGASTAGLYHDVPGPSLHGLFLQSRLGVVVGMTLFLEPLPNFVYAFQGSVSENTLPDLIDTLQNLMLRNILPEHGCTLWNGYKLHGIEQRRVERAEGMRMFLSGAIYQESEQQAQLTIEMLNQRLEPSVKDLVFSPIKGPSLLTGTPTTRHLKGVENQGVIWLCPVTPFDGRLAAQVIEVIESLMDAYNVQPQIGIECGAGRTLEWFIAIVYDRAQSGADAAALDCHQALTEALQNMGHLPYRLSILDSQRYVKENPQLQRLYDAFDPQRIFV